MWAQLFSCCQALMTTSAELSQKGNHAERHWENLQWEWLRAPGTVIVAENKEESKWWGGRQRRVSSCASSVAQLGLSVVLWSGASLSCCHRGQTSLIRLASTLQAAKIQRKSAAEEEWKGTKRATEALWSFYLLCVCARAHTCVCVQSHPHAMIIQCVMYVCVFFKLPVRVVGCEIGSLCSSAPQSCFHRFLSSVRHHLSLHHNLRLTISLPRQWPCYRPFHTPPSMSVFLSPSLPSCSSSSLFPPLSSLLSTSLCLSSSLVRRQFCVIKSMVALLVGQLCHPDGQIKNWFLRLIPCTGWMLLPSSLPLLFHSFSQLPSQLHIGALSLRLQLPPSLTFCDTIFWSQKPLLTPHLPQVNIHLRLCNWKGAACKACPSSFPVVTLSQS